MTRRAPHSATSAAPDLVQRTGKPWTIYLIHAPVPVGRVSHYLGITRTDRLALRMREHAHRRGSSLTAQMAATNDHLLLVRTWTNVDWADERRMKAAGHYRRLCPICSKAPKNEPITRIICPNLTALEDQPEHVTLGSALRPVHTR